MNKLHQEIENLEKLAKACKELDEVQVIKGRIFQTKKCIEIFKDMLDKFRWKIKDVDNKDVDNAVRVVGNETFMDMHNEDLEELKSQLDEVEK